VILTLISKLAGNREAILIYVLIAAGAALYAWGATASADRDALSAWAKTTCAAAGTTFSGSGASRGAACGERVLALAELNRTHSEASAKVLADAMNEQQRLASADLTTARKQMEVTADALRRMEQENAKIDKTDRVGGDWFLALNRLGGLREPATR
jgi:hypothetical protein